MINLNKWFYKQIRNENIKTINDLYIYLSADCNDYYVILNNKSVDNNFIINNLNKNNNIIINEKLKGGIISNIGRIT